MASKWQHAKHGILVATGVTLSGVTIFFSADRDRVRPQDVYEIQAGYVERIAASRGLTSGGSSGTRNIGAVTTNTYTYPVMTATGVPWYEYDDNAGTITTNEYFTSAQTYTNISTVVTGFVGYATETLEESVATGRKIIWRGWEYLDVSGMPYEYDGRYLYDAATKTYTNDATDTVIIRLPFRNAFEMLDTARSFGEGFRFTGQAPDILNYAAPDYTQFKEFIGPISVSNAVVTASSSIVTSAVMDFAEAEIVPYKNVSLEFDVRAGALPDARITQDLWSFYGGLGFFFSSTNYNETMTRTEIMETAHASQHWFNYPFVSHPTSVVTTVNEIYQRIPWIYFEDQGWGSNTVYLVDKGDGFFHPVIETAWTHEGQTRITKDALFDRYDALHDLGDTTQGSFSWVDRVRYDWTGGSTNSLAEAISNAMAATPTITNTTIRPRRVGYATQSASGGVTNFVASYSAVRAKPSVSYIYGSINKSLSFFTQFTRPPGFSGATEREFFSSEEYDYRNSLYATTEGWPHTVGEATNYTHAAAFPLVYEPELDYFPSVTGISKGWSSYDFSFGFGTINTVFAKWEFEYVNTPRE